MATRLIIAAAVLLNARAQSVRQDLPKFMGREVTITEPESDPDGFFPKGPASVCLEGPPQRQCYTAPKEFGNNPSVELVVLKKDMPALLFSAESGGVSGWGIHFALLRPGMGAYLDDILSLAGAVSNQNRRGFLNDPAISDAQIFVTADYVWGPDEGHYGPHRYVVSAYVLMDSDLYYLQDRYMTIHKYDLDANDDILASEKPGILARLNRIKSEAENQQQAPR